MIKTKPFNVPEEPIDVSLFRPTEWKACFNIEIPRSWNEYLKFGEKKEISTTMGCLTYLQPCFAYLSEMGQISKPQFWIFHSSSFSDTRHNAFSTRDKRRERRFSDKNICRNKQTMKNWHISKKKKKLNAKSKVTCRRLKTLFFKQLFVTNVTLEPHYYYHPKYDTNISTYCFIGSKGNLWDD